MPERFNEQFSIEINTVLKKYEQEKGIQIRYVPKIHPIPSENTILKFEEIIRKIEDLRTVPHILVNQYGRPLPFTLQPASTEIVVGTETALPLLRKGEKTERLLNFVREELNQVKDGYMKRPSTFRALCGMFGYKSPGSLRLFLIRHGLERERSKTKPEMQTDSLKPKQRKRRNVIEVRDISAPSDQMAWMLGILSAGGYTKPGIGSLSLRSKDPMFTNAFRVVGEELFGVNAYPDTTPDGSSIIFFHSKALTSALGDLRSGNWPATIMERYSWITDNERYIWKFLEGYLDKSGAVRNTKAVKRIGFFAQYENAGNFLAEMLVKAGVEKPVFHHKGSGKLAEVVIGNIRDIKRIASNIHLKSVEKEKELEELRSYSSHFDRSVNATDSDLMHEWMRLRKLLGHTPTSYDVQELKRRKETSYHYKSYVNRFGGGSFIKASEHLERMVSEGEK